MTNPVPTSGSAASPKRSIPAWVLAAGVSWLVSVAIVLPFFWLGSASGHDFEFHAASWLDAAYQWHEGTVYPRWTAWTNHGFGEPRFTFYPPLSWVLGAALTLILPVAWVPVVFIALTQTFAGISAFFLLRRLASERAAILAAAFYAANPDALLITYIRSDFAEQLACAFFPLLLLATLKLADLPDDASPVSSRIVFFALSFAAVWLSNAPAGVIATYSVTLLFIWVTVAQGAEKMALRGVAGLALGFGLTAFYLVPAAYEQRWVNIAQALASGLLPLQNFLFTKIDDPEHTWFNWIASICALLLILPFGVTALASRRFSREVQARDKNHRIWNSLLLVGAAASILTLPLTSFLWDFLPKLRFVQFPWRWMSIVALIAACFLASAIDRPRGWLSAVAALALLPLLGYFLVYNGWWDPDEMSTQQAAITSGTGYDGTDEYDPLGDDHTDLPSAAPPAVLLPATPDDKKPPAGRVEIEQWNTEQKQVRVRIVADGRVALRLLNYPAWRVTLNGKAVTPDRLEGVSTNQMVIPVPAGDSQIRVQFTRTPDRTIGLMLFSLSLVVVAILLLAGG